MREVAIARRLVRLARGIVSGEVLIAQNSSYWQWEYDSNSRRAELSLNTASGKLSLKIVEERRSSGLGGDRTRSATIFDQGVGTLAKPKLQNINSALKKYGHERTRAGGPFPRNGWSSEEFQVRDAKLANVIMAARAKYSIQDAEPEVDPQEKLLEFVKGLDSRGAAHVMRRLGI